VTFDDASFVYDGTAKTLAITGTLPAGASVSYTLDGAAGNGATNAGTYDLVATITGGTNYNDLVLNAELEITKATITGITFTDGSFVYDGTEKTLAISGTLPAGTSVTYTIDGAAGNGATNVDTYHLVATISGGANYNDLILNAELEITKATITGITFTDGSFVYDGTEKTLTITGTLPAGTSVTYTIDGNAGNGATNVGTYDLVATITGGTNYNDLVLNAELEITKATITGITFTDGSFVYDGTEKTLAITGTLPAGASVSYTNNVRTDEGSQTVTATITGGTNYQDLILIANLEITITKSDIIGITFVDGSFEYDGTEKMLAITGTLPAGTSISYINNGRTEPGSQTVTVNISGGTNYNDLVLNAELEITKANLTGITFTDGSFVYDGTEKTLAITGTLPAGASVSYTNNGRTDEGSQTVTATITGGTNYHDLSLTAQLTITKANLNGITFTDGSFVYDGQSKSLQVLGLPPGATAIYTGNGQVNVGIYPVQAKVSLPGHTDLQLEATLTITAAPRTLIFPPLAEKTYGDPSFYAGAQTNTGQQILYSSSNHTVATVDDQGMIRIVGAGETEITAQLANNTNYQDVAPKTRALKIHRAAQRITLRVPQEVPLSAGTLVLDGSASSGLTPTFSVDDPQIATVEGSSLHIHRLGTIRLTASQAGNQNYESAEAVTVSIRVIDPALTLGIRVHQALSPNGDGTNDFLLIEGIRDYPENKLLIFDQNGREVWQGTGYDNASVSFRGIGLRGHRMPQGTYFYILEIRVNGSWTHEKGWFVIRY